MGRCLDRAGELLPVLRRLALVVRGDGTIRLALRDMPSGSGTARLSGPGYDCSGGVRPSIPASSLSLHRKAHTLTKRTLAELQSTQSAPKATATPDHDDPMALACRTMGGSKSPAFNTMIMREVLASTWDQPERKDDDRRLHALAAVSASMAFKPQDEIEAMIAAQVLALHFGAMECLRRAMIPTQTFEVASKLRRDGANLARGMTDMLEALDRKRGKGPQVVRVERVVVHEGGQAIVGNVQPGPGAKAGEG
jgi:hypothetical protein